MAKNPPGQKAAFAVAQVESVGKKSPALPREHTSYFVYSTSTFADKYETSETVQAIQSVGKPKDFI